jgi:hypothetical protein
MKLKHLLNPKIQEKILVENIVNSTEKMKQMMAEQYGIPNAPLTQEQKSVLLKEIEEDHKNAPVISAKELLDKIHKW